MKEYYRKNKEDTLKKNKTRYEENKEDNYALKESRTLEYVLFDL